VTITNPVTNAPLVGGMLIDGRGGEPIQRSVVLIDGKKIVAAFRSSLAHAIASSRSVKRPALGRQKS
jgi:hypothetical protein